MSQELSQRTPQALAEKQGWAQTLAAPRPTICAHPICADCQLGDHQ